ncbi:hypothetical protein ABIB58_001135 [Brevundimonas sp. UYEF29]|uniref:hypothetical protein n=1 Tax=Brevundimonas sp. UYEF29 TaxID=3156346 RepID=UPI00339AE48C
MLDTAYGFVRTSSHQWDGGGGRTDLHDMLGLLWAGVLRANGVASAHVAGEQGWCGAPEIAARTLFFDQLQRPNLSTNGPSELERLVAHTGWAAHAIHTAIGMEEPQLKEPTYQWDVAPSWLDGIGKHYAIDKGIFVSRRNPDWEYFVNRQNTASIIRLTGENAVELRSCFSFFEPRVAMLGEDFAVLAGGIRNVVAASSANRAVKLLHIVEGKSALPWIGAGATVRDYVT